MIASTPAIRDALRRAAVPRLHDTADEDRLMDRIGDAPFVLLGEATHGTHEFYAFRARLTQRLIEERGFSAVAVEADWPNAYRVNRFVRGQGADQQAVDSLGDFHRFPLWMWRNAEVLEFIGWLREHNDALPAVRRVGFYGLDLYSLYESIAAVIDYLDRVDPESARRARDRYACFDHGAGDDAEHYGRHVGLGLRADCERQAVAQLVELRRHMADYLQRDGLAAEDEQFFAEQNARVIRDAEGYYRQMFVGRVNTWNLRDRHMAETLTGLTKHMARTGRPGKVVVWAHNSHLGDARATDMQRQGELNLGQLVREQYGGQAVLVGMTTYAGHVAAASEWDGPVRRRRLRPALPGSYEALLHEADLEQALILPDDPPLSELLAPARLERMVGVIYRPQTERSSHYFHCRLPEQFDAVLHVDHTRPVEPLDRDAGWEAAGELPDTYPRGY